MVKKFLLTMIFIGGAIAFNNQVTFAEIPTSEITAENLSATEKEIYEKGFFVKKIDDKLFAKIKGKSFKDNCTLPLDDLRYLHVLHKDLDGKIHEGELICNAYIADDLIDIFQKLYLANYPIEKIRLVD